MFGGNVVQNRTDQLFLCPLQICSSKAFNQAFYCQHSDCLLQYINFKKVQNYRLLFIMFSLWTFCWLFCWSKKVKDADTILFSLRDTYVNVKQLNYIHHVWTAHYIGQDLFVLRNSSRKYESVFVSRSSFVALIHIFVTSFAFTVWLSCHLK